MTRGEYRFLHVFNRKIYLTVGVIYFLTFLIALPFLFQRIPYSLYFTLNADKVVSEIQVKDQIERDKSAQRLTDYISVSGIVSTHSLLSEHSLIDVVIGIVTIPRPNGLGGSFGYLTRTVDSVVQETLFNQNSSDLRVAFFVCNVHTGPGVHEEAEKLSPLVPVIVKQISSGEARSFDLFQKETEDYNFCLREATKFQTKYVLILEDDTILIDNFLPSLNRLLTSIGENKDFILKLFYPPRWQGFSLDGRHFVELAFTGLLFASCAHFVRLILSFVFSRRRLLRYRKSNYYIVYLLVFVYGVLFALVLGRQNILELRKPHPLLHTLVPAPECCTPAVVYPRRTAIKLSNFLNRTKTSWNYQFDQAVEDFRRSQSVPAFLVEPSIVRHIGLVSTLKGISTNPEEFYY